MKRMTVVVPVALAAAAGHTVALMRKSQSLTSYDEAGWQDSDGNLYAVSSGLWSAAQIEGVQNPDIINKLSEEEAIPEIEGLDLSIVSVAQGAFQIATDMDGTSLDPTKITAFMGDNPHQMITALGLTVIPTEEDTQNP